MTRTANPMDIEKLATFYERLEPVVKAIEDNGKMNTPVKEGGWTPKQLIHHLADAQTQAFYRILWIITEDNTTLKPFDQNDWVGVTGEFPVSASMAMLKGVYSRWYHLMRGLSEDQMKKTGNHPEIGEVIIDSLADYYISHGESHVEQFAGLAQD